MREIVEQEIKKRTAEEFEANSMSTSRVQMTAESNPQISKTNETYQKKMMLLKKNSGAKSYKSGNSPNTSGNFDSLFEGVGPITALVHRDTLKQKNPNNNKMYVFDQESSDDDDCELTDEENMPRGYVKQH